ncbi:hypothetical protein V495_00338 [Pseudogymnoascus sp. VKM F-4514 (FW-929)]|nr:hypothetical protein V495_00338 [Pseudogymnoascus sp. VKM F-4514 (FW-929)]KFY66783.1 hypothetical protein V497_00730 [Pseudogymnoascus sp. VKM F-4516 (FW-969)]
MLVVDAPSPHITDEITRTSINSCGIPVRPNTTEPTYNCDPAEPNSLTIIPSMDSDLSKQSLWVPRRASTASPTDTPTSPTNTSQAQPSVPEHAEDDAAPAPLSPSDPTSIEPQQRQRRDSRVKNTGRRIAQIVKLKPEFVEQYKEYHANVWPEVLKQIKECQIRDYSIFHDPATGILFASFLYVGYGFADDMERMRDNPKVREWWALTDGMQESLNDGAVSSADGGWWREVESVFYAA